LSYTQVSAKRRREPLGTRPSVQRSQGQL
jgi:hypothetical protein